MFLAEMGRKGGLQNTAESAQSGPNVVGKWVAHVLKFKNHEEKIINRRGPLEISMNLGLRASRIGWSNCMWLREQNAIPKIRVLLVNSFVKSFVFVNSFVNMFLIADF